MKLWPVTPRCLARRRRSSGYTLVEILVASTLTLILMTAVVRVFSGVGNGITSSRRALEAFDRLRATASQLRMDLQGVTVTMLPPRRPENNEGYFEIVESGPAGTWLETWNPDDPNDTTARTNIQNIQRFSSDPIAVSNPSTGRWDSTVGQRGDILLFTTRNSARPFVGRCDPRYVPSADGTIQSDVAEVAWFLRGRTLHRRVLLVAPGIQPQLDAVAAINWWPPTALLAQFCAFNDISIRVAPPPGGGAVRPMANTLSDLTRRECRFGHPTDLFPFDVRRWGLLGLPTLWECASPFWNATLTVDWTKGWTASWVAGAVPCPVATTTGTNLAPPTLDDFKAAWLSVGGGLEAIMDPWSGSVTDVATGPYRCWTPDYYLIKTAAFPAGQGFSASSPPAQRTADDVVLTNVIGFDVKVWDPGAPIYWKTVNGQAVVVKPGDRGYDPADYNSGAIVPIGYGAYVDLGYDFAVFDPTYVQPAGRPPRLFHHLGRPKSALYATQVSPRIARVYDTWSSNYEIEGIYHFDPGTGNLVADAPASYPAGLGPFAAGNSVNGFDDLGQEFIEQPNGSIVQVAAPATNGVVDSPDEQITSPPYPVPLRGIQVKIRVFEPDSRQVREVTIEQDFLPK